MEREIAEYYFALAKTYPQQHLPYRSYFQTLNSLIELNDYKSAMILVSVLITKPSGDIRVRKHFVDDNLELIGLKLYNAVAKHTRPRETSPESDKRYIGRGYLKKRISELEQKLNPTPLREKVA